MSLDSGGEADFTAGLEPTWEMSSEPEPKAWTPSPPEFIFSQEMSASGMHRSRSWRSFTTRSPLGIACQAIRAVVVMLGAGSTGQAISPAKLSGWVVRPDWTQPLRASARPRDAAARRRAVLRGRDRLWMLTWVRPFRARAPVGCRSTG